ncbi:MAG: MFS transporter [Alphaproteobacteria bacterium]|nr:MFS transporter [Alphaproteobacteria bacterium]
MSANPAAARPARALAFATLAAGAVLGLGGTDLVLPAVPSLPSALGGTPGQAQLVLAAYVAGSGAGLLLFGELGARFDQRLLLIGSLLGFSALSTAAAYAPDLEALIALRAGQGAAGAAAAVFAPGMLRASFDAPGAVKAIGLLGSIESLTPALAPIAGVWLLAIGGWRASFAVLAIGAALLAAAVFALRGRLPRIETRVLGGGYGRLLISPVYLRYALSQAFTLGGLLTFVFGAPAVMTGPLGLTLTDFIVMQVSGIMFFILGANLAGAMASRFGAERMIFVGSAVSAAGAVALLAYGVAGGGGVLAITILWVPVNLGLGLRGPPGFFRAVQAARGDDARGVALVILAILLTTAAGTAAAAPFITLGLAPLAGIAAMISCASVLVLMALPRLPREAAGP